MINEVVYYTQPGPVWDWPIALDLFLGGAGVGALLLAVLLDERFKGKYRRICHTAAWLAPLLILAGLLLIMLKQGRPFQLFQTYTNFNPTSPLWWGGIFQPLLVLGAFAYAIRWRQSQADDTGRRWLGRILAPLAVIVGAYHGLLLAVMAAHPLWNAGPTVIAALLGFASTGIAVVMLIHLIRMKIAGRLADVEHVTTFLGDMSVVRNILFSVLILQLGTYFLWWLSLSLGSLQDQLALAAANEACGSMFWWGGVGLGLILPLGLGAFAVVCSEAGHRGLHITMIGLTSILILVGGFIFRLALLLGGQAELPVPIIS